MLHIYSAQREEIKCMIVAVRIIIQQIQFSKQRKTMWCSGDNNETRR